MSYELKLVGDVYIAHEEHEEIVRRDRTHRHHCENAASPKAYILGVCK